jgi:predicted metalloprotease
LLAAPPHGVVALEIVAAHEVGHAVQYHLGFDGDLDKSPYVGTMNAQEVAADCLSGVYMKSTGIPTTDLDRALALTALGGNVVREQAFHEGLVETNPQNCMDRFLG